MRKLCFTILVVIVVMILFSTNDGICGECAGTSRHATNIADSFRPVDNHDSISFVAGGFSAIKNGVTTFSRSNRRYCSRQPVNEGIYRLKGHLRVAASQRVKRTLQNDSRNASYEVYGGVNGRYVSYDKDQNITTIEIYSSEPFVLSLGKEDNSAFGKNEFELLSYTPFEKYDRYNVQLQTVNPCEGSSEIMKCHEPTMVIADDGTIIIAAYCDRADGERGVLNTVSKDGGKTWKTNWTSGILSMVWDRYNHRLCGVRSGESFVSYDYGMTWEIIGSYDKSYVTPEMAAFCQQYREAEKEAYLRDRSKQRYSYRVYTVNTGNSGIQLDNGVICMPMLIRLKKSLACKNEKGKWITDGNGFCKPLNTKTEDFEKVVAYVLYSKDFGVTWEQSVATSTDIICEETCLTEVLPNQVCMNSRGGTESFWSTAPSVRRIHIQKKLVDDRESFVIDSWDSEWGTRPTNTIEDALVNADIEKVKHFNFADSKENDLSFWLFCNINNPGSFARKGLMLRLSTDGRNWYDVGYLTPSNKFVGGYCEMAADESHIYIVYEGNRDTDPLSFARIDDQMRDEIQAAYALSVKRNIVN